MPADAIRIADNNNIPETINAMQMGIRVGLEKLGEATHGQIVEQWDRDRDAMGRDWPDLAPLTIKLKGHSAILRDTRDMQHAMGYEVETRGGDGAIGGGGGRLEVYNTDWKAKFHEFGAPDANIPKRAFIRPGADWVDAEGMDDAFEPTLQAAVQSAMLTTTSVR